MHGSQGSCAARHFIKQPQAPADKETSMGAAAAWEARQRTSPPQSPARDRGVGWALSRACGLILFIRTGVRVRCSVPLTDLICILALMPRRRYLGSKLRMSQTFK